ncbi:MAG: GIY-YIG nuclease family protein [Candidatus Pacebacteria bacterium]|nr:GIY-YIG nuclease family protein [Candidatus Paceibacterota bacterium]
MTYFVYILRCADTTLYTGITTDIARRLVEHQKGVGGRYTRAKGAIKILYTERKKNRSTASQREAEIKQLSRKAKLLLIKSGKKTKKPHTPSKKSKRVV